jgi:hypothetical protein
MSNSGNNGSDVFKKQNVGSLIWDFNAIAACAIKRRRLNFKLDMRKLSNQFFSKLFNQRIDNENSIACRQGSRRSGIGLPPCLWKKRGRLLCLL